MRSQLKLRGGGAGGGCCLVYGDACGVKRSTSEGDGQAEWRLRRRVKRCCCRRRRRVRFGREGVTAEADMASASNPCCSAWQEKYRNMMERRTHLRNGMKILESKIKTFKDQQNRADALEEEKLKEASLRTSLEDEVAALKSRICSIEADTNCKNELEKETLLLRECISEKEGEIEQLKKLLAEGDSGPVKGKKASPTDKKKIAELQKNLKSEKNRADEACELVDEAKRKSEEDKILVETLNIEVASLKSRICSTDADVNCKNSELEKETLLLRECISEKEGEIEQLKKLLEDGNSGSVKGKKVSSADKRKITELQKSLKSEKNRADETSKLLDEAKRKSEEDITLVETLNNEVKNITQKFEEANRMFESEKQTAIVEKKKADEEKAKANELRKIAEVNERKASDEKFQKLMLAKERNHADALRSKLEEQARTATENEKRAMEEESRSNEMIQELESARQKLRDVEIQLCEFKQCRDLAGASSTPTELHFNKQNAEVSFLHEQLKFERKRVKHYKEVAKLEKDLRSALQQELHDVKQDFQSLLYQMDMLSDTFGARNHMNKKRRLNAGNLELPGRTLDCGLPPLNFCCDAERRPSSLSSMDTSFRLKPNSRLVDAEQPMESPSGMKINLDPLQGGSHGDILASSPLNSNTASFSDEQLLGSQERAACTLTTLTGLTTKDPVPQTTIAKWNDGERVATVTENSVNPVELDSGHVKKRRKIVDESELVRCVESQDKISNRDAELNLFGLGKVLAQPMKEQMEKVNLLVTSNNGDASANVDLSWEKKKSTNEPQLVLQRVNNTTVPSGKDISQPNECQISGLVVPDQDALVSFEQQLNGHYMKLLDLDDPIAEEHFRMALEWPLSPTLPEIEPHNFDQEVEMRNLGIPVCAGNIPTDLNGEHDKIPKFCVVFSDMEDIGCITKIFCTTTTCMARLRSSLQTHWLVEDILLVLVSEQDLVSREMICVFFSLLLLNFSRASCTKPMDFQSLLSDTFCANLQSVLLNRDIRHLFTKVCCLSDLLSLSENFLLHKKILLGSSLTSDTGNCGDSYFEILHQGESNVLRPSLASTNMVVAGSLILASISAAAGLVDSICEFSLKIIRMRRADCLMTTLILHTFAYVCGEEYFTISNYHAVMEAVKVIVASLECSSAINGNIQPDDGTLRHCFPCEKCPFTERSICLDDVSSKLIEEVQGFTNTHFQADTSDSCLLFAILSALELLASHMSWGWVCDRVVSKLFEMLESCDPQSIMSSAVITLLGDLGRLGVETGGYDDPGVKSIVQQLSASLHRTSSSKHSTFSMAVVHSLTQLHANGAEVFLKNNEESIKGAHPASSKATSDILRTMFSSLSDKPTSALHNCVVPVT
ncbi:hypothetical protein KSS87_003795 [Heliosperma pusillum]|nr:hypothetical protein KSS87_003795 [Heliosperma pusillum]